MNRNRSVTLMLVALAGLLLLPADPIAAATDGSGASEVEVAVPGVRLSSPLGDVAKSAESSGAIISSWTETSNGESDATFETEEDAFGLDDAGYLDRCSVWFASAGGAATATARPITRSPRSPPAG